ncbi:mannose-1-phosphate guanylyltransferase [Candidatus Dependentiae bacterium]|nr:mannose-1-phosphate guanylyltransferase [Candidatus Dependentiae bacterium]
MIKKLKTYFVILAGGSGARLWPLSSPDRPKQLIPFLNETSLLEQTVDRITPLTQGPEDIIVVTHERYEDAVMQVVGDSVGAVFAEPASRNTAPALMAVLAYLAELEDDALVVVLPSDHFIPDTGKFLTECLNALDIIADQESLAIFGAQPTFSATGYGYIQGEQQVKSGFVKVTKFHEKPDQKTAQVYLDQGNYFWNMGIIMGKLSSFLQEYEQHAPDLYHALMLEQDIATAYEKIASISLDVAVLEKSKNVIVFPWTSAWHDVGNMQTFLELEQRYGSSKSSRVITVDSLNNIICSSKKIVACVGVSDICLVETDDTLLIVAKKDIELVKKVVEQLEE